MRPLPRLASRSLRSYRPWLPIATLALAAPLVAWAAPRSQAPPTLTTGAHQWSQRYGDEKSQGARHVTFDAAGNIYVVGQFYGLMDLGGGPLVAAGVDLFIAKFDAGGSHIWSRSFGDAAAQYANAIAVDPDGRVIVAGYFNGTIDFGGGALVSNTVDLFLVQFDADGNHRWSRSFGDSRYQFSKDIAVDALGNIVLVADLVGTVDFGGGPLSTITPYDNDVVIAKFASDGNHLWSRRFGDGDGQSVSGMAIDASGNVVLTGYFAGSLDFGAGALVADGYSDVFVAKLDPTGAQVWAHDYGDAEVQDGWDVAFDATGNVILGGTFNGVLDFGTGPLTNAGDGDLFVAKFDANGTPLWSRAHGNSTLFEDTILVAADPTGAIWITGDFEGDIDLGSGVLVHQGENDIFIAKYDSEGTPLWSRGFGDAAKQYPTTIAASSTGHIAVAGWFVGEMDFGGGPLVSSGTAADLFIVVLADPGTTDVPAPRARTVLEQNRPNPFNPMTEISYEISSPGRVLLDVRDVRGRLVATLVDEAQVAGRNSVRWDGTDHRGRRVASGDYFYSIRAHGLSQTRKMTIVK